MRRKAWHIKIGCLLLAGLFILASSSHLCFSLPEPEEVASGTAEFVYPDAATLEIKAIDKTIINYKSFDIKETESVIINLPAVNSEVLNRVLGNKASEILGRLSCNGIFILVNKNGIYFGPNANVDTASLIASTRDITNSDFLSSKYIFGKLSGQQMDTLLLNQGKLNIRKAGFGVLIAGAIENQGTIVAPLGTIALAGGDLVTLDISSDGLISVAINQTTAKTVLDYQGKPVTDQLKNTGTLQADGGAVLLDAESLPGVFEKAINLAGYVRANKLEEKDGVIRIVSSGKVTLSGEISASRIMVGEVDEAIPESIEGKLSAEEYISLIVQALSVKAVAPEVNLFKTGGIEIMSSHSADDLITLEGPGMNVTYLKDAKLSLETDMAVNTSPGVIILANEVKIIAKQFGTLEVPLAIEANTTYINRPRGNIEILESLGIGSTIMLRGPPDGFGAIIYNKDTNLVLETQKGDIYLHQEVNISVPSLSLFAQGKVISYATIQTPLFYEKGESLLLAGTTIIGRAFLSNLDNAVDIAGDITGTIEDAVNINFVGDVNLIGDTTLKADSDQDQSGKIIMNGYSLFGNNYNLTLYTGEDSTLDGDITAVATLELYSSTENTKTYTSTATNFSVNTLKTNYYAIFSRNKVEDGYQMIYSVSNAFGGLQYIQNNLSGNYKLANNIDASETQNWNAGAGFAPMGNYDTGGFTGTFDGDNHTISNLYINRPSSHYVGLFGYIYNAEIRNVGLTNVNILGYGVVGGLVGWNRGTVSSSYATGTVSGGDNVGGLVGVNDGAITNSYTTVNVSRTLSTPSCSGFGGLVGQSIGTISNSYATGSVSNGWQGSGGLVGYNGGNIYNSYATGNVSGDNCVGGLAGLHQYDSTITNSYSTGSVNGSYWFGGLVGYLTSGTIINSYWNMETSGQATSAGGEGKTTQEMMNPATYSGWDFSVAGNGTIGNWIMAGYPHLQMEHTTTITNVVQLQLMVVDLTASYTLANNIDASETSTWNWTGSGTDYYGFAPVGDSSSYFTGTFDGDNHTISNLYINRSATDQPVGLFGYTWGSNIKNVGLVNVAVSGNYNVGGLVGFNHGRGPITSSYSTGSVSGNYYVGGLVGYNYGGTITNCYATGSVSGGDAVGGLVGGIAYETITNSYATGTVTGNYNVGGLVGYSSTEWYWYCNITNSYATGNVSGSYYVGGLLGSGMYTSIANSYATGAVTGNYYVGGLIGTGGWGGTISNSYATGAVSGQYYVGGLMGKNDISLTNSYATGNVSGTNSVGGLVGDHWGYITNSYATGTVVGDDSVGGLVGYEGYGSIINSYTISSVNGTSTVGGLIGYNSSYASWATISNNFWLKTDTYNPTLQDTGNNGDISEVTYKNDVEMKQQTTFANWDFISMWAIKEGLSYPYLLNFPWLWTGGGGEDASWTNPLNWDRGYYAGYPDSKADKVFIKTGSDTISTPSNLVLGELQLGINYTGTLILAGSLTLDNTGGHSGDLYIYNGTLDLNGYNLTIAGSFSNSGTFNHNFGTVTFNSNLSGNTIASGGTSFFDLDFNGAGVEWNLQDDLTVGGNLTITDGTLDLNGHNLSLAETSAFFNTATLKLVGSEALTNFTNDTVSGTVEYYGAETYSGLAAGDIYYHLIFSGSGTYILDNGLDVAGNLSIGSASALDLNGNDLNLGGTFFNQGTLKLLGSETVTWAANDADSGTVEYYGSGSYFELAAGDAYYNLVISGGTYTLDNTDLTISSSFTNNGTFIHNSGTITFNATSTGNTITSGNASFNNLIFDGAGGEWTLEGNLIVNGNLAVSNGKVIQDTGNTLTISGDLSLGSGAEWQKADGSSVIFSPPGTSTWTDNTASGQDLGAVYVQAGSSTLNIIGSVKCTSLSIDTGHTVVMTENSSLSLTGTGTPLSGTGILDTSTYTPNTIQYLSDGTTNITAAGPVSAYYNLALKGSGFARAGALTLASGEDYLFAAVIDTANGYAYFGVYTSPGMVVKIRLSDFTEVGILTLDSSNEYLASSVIDTTNGYAYFGTDTWPAAKIVKVALSDFTEVGAITLSEGELWPWSAVIDTANGYAYFGTWNSPAKVIKINISPDNFSRVDAITLPSDEHDLASAVIDTVNGYAYFGTNMWGQADKVVKINISPDNFSRVDAVTLEPNEDYLEAAVIDIANGYAYFGTWTAPAKVVKINISPDNFSRVDALTFAEGENYLWNTGVIDTVNGYAYFGTYNWWGAPDKIIKVRLSDFSRASSLTLSEGEYSLSCAVIDIANGYAYFGTWTYPGKIIKVALNAPTGTAIFGTDTAQTLTINGDLTVNNYIVDADTFDPAITVKGNLTLNGNSRWQKSDSATLTFSPTGTKVFTDNTQDTQDLGAVLISGGADSPTLELATPMKATSLGIASGHTLDLFGNNLTLSEGAIFSNEGTLKLFGSEVLTNFTSDADSGTVEYYGSGTYPTLVAGTAYYNLTISGPGSFTADSSLQVNDDFTQSSGTFISSDPINNAFSVEGSFSLIGGTFNRFTGSGTPEAPYLIYDVYGLQAMSCDLAAYYTLFNDIDASGTQNWNWTGSSTDYYGFAPIGHDWSHEFTGIFDGDNHTITGLYINRPGNCYVGLFGILGSTGQISNVGVAGVDITGHHFMGGLAGWNYGPITNSYATGNVSASYGDVGGLVGVNYGPITNSYATGNVSAIYGEMGGLVGVNEGPITNSYATGIVSGTEYVGGLVGYNEGPITNSYATGVVTGSSYIGGLVGYNDDWQGTATITNSYATSNVSGDYFVGGLVGYSDGTITNSYWNTETSGQTTSAGGEGKTTQEMMNSATFVDWDFSVAGNGTIGNWIMAGYPHLQMEHTTTITNIVQLQLMAVDLTASYTLANDIEASETSTWNWDGAKYSGFAPVGNYDTGEFSGTFDGDNHTISNLYINRPTTECVGLFGWLENGQIINIGLLNVNITGDSEVGGLVGEVGYGSIISYTYATGSVNGFSLAGGLAGYNIGTISNSYATGTVSGDEYIGGLVGGNDYYGSIINSYATGNVSGDYAVGGLAGWSDQHDTISNTYSIGTVSGNTNVGGFIGEDYSVDENYTANFWDNTVNTSLADVGNLGDVEGITGKSTLEMKQQSTFTDADWNFTVVGDGTIGNWIMAGYPHLQMEHTTTITNVVQLQLMAVDLTADYTLSNDIDASETSSWNGGAGFEPVGNISAFTGIFNGNNYTINDLYVNRGSNNYVGLFSYLGNTAQISNVGLLNVSISGYNYVGGLVGVNYGTITNSSASGSTVGTWSWWSGGGCVGGLVGVNYGAISNSYATGSVSGDGSVGGLVGFNQGDIIDSYATRSVSGGRGSVGGLVGGNSGTITNSYATGSASAYDYVGGLVGYNSGAITNSYATGNADYCGGWQGHGNNIGGLAGYSSGYITNSYATGSVSGNNSIGGLVGYNNYGMLTDSYFTGSVSGNSSIGGLVGYNSGAITNSHYDIDSVSINNRNYVITVGALYPEQYSAWLDNDKTLNINNYLGYDPDTGYYLISDITDLKNFLGFCDNNYKFRLTQDIDLSLEPDFYVPYLSVLEFDGNNKIISNLNVNLPFNSRVGFFGYVSSGEIKNLGLIDVNITGWDSVGGLAGLNASGTITNSYATGSVSGEYIVGGLVGYNSGYITNSYATGNVSGDYYVGGLAGYNYFGTITNSYATASVSGSGYVAGFLGFDYGYYYWGYYWGWGWGDFSSDYWLKTDTLNSNLEDTGHGDIGGITSLNDAQMKQQATFTGWDFESIWTIDENWSYPHFQYQVWTWDGEGDGTSWTDPSNWNKDAGYPHSSGDRAVIDSGSSTIVTPLSSNLTVGAITLGVHFLGTLKLENNLILDSSGPLLGNLAISGSAAAFDLNAEALSIGGSFFNNGTFNHNLGTVTFNGTTPDKTIASGTAHFYNLIFDGIGGNWSLQDALNVDGDLSIINGALDLNGNSLSLAETSVFSNTATLKLVGSESILNLTNDTDSGTVEYYGDQTYSGLAIGDTYYHLVFSGTGTYILNNHLEVKGNLLLNNGALDLNGNGLTLRSTFSNTGTLKLLGPETLTGFINDTDSGTIEYYGDGYYPNLAAGNNYYNLVFSGTGTFVSSPLEELTVNNSFSLISGIFHRFTGSGIQEDPYLIYDVYGLQAMKCYLSSYFELANDIDASVTSNWNSGQGFIPVGDWSNQFTGVFDGDNYAIFNLYMNRPTTEDVGLFGVTSNGSEIKNLGLINVSIAGYHASYSEVGSLVGWNYGTITNIYATGNVSGSWYVGGLVSSNSGAINNSYAAVNVSGTGNCWDVGGLVSDNYATISNSYATGNVSGNYDTGGLVGWNYGTITNSYATGNVSGIYYVGGFVGYHNGGSYAANFWDSTVNPSLADVGNIGDVAGITGITTAEMKQQATFSGWNFETIWAIDEEQTYPYFRYQPWFWDAGGDGSSWADPLNWDRNSGYPDIKNDKVIINTGNATIYTPAGSTLTIGAITLGANFSGILSLEDSLTLDNSGSRPGELTISNPAAIVYLNGKAFTISSSFLNKGTLRLIGSENVTGFSNDTNSGTVEYYGYETYSRLAAGDNYYNLVFSGSGIYILDNHLEVNGNLLLNNGALDLNGNNLSLAATSAFSNNGTLKLLGTEALTNFTNDIDSGTVYYYGSGVYASLPTGNKYYNLVFDTSGPLDIRTDVTAFGYINIYAVDSIDVSADIVAGSIDISSDKDVNIYGLLKAENLSHPNWARLYIEADADRDGIGTIYQALGSVMQAGQDLWMYAQDYNINGTLRTTEENSYLGFEDNRAGTLGTLLLSSTSIVECPEIYIFFDGDVTVNGTLRASTRVSPYSRSEIWLETSSGSFTQGPDSLIELTVINNPDYYWSNYGNFQINAGGDVNLNGTINLSGDIYRFYLQADNEWHWPVRGDGVGNLNLSNATFNINANLYNIELSSAGDINPSAIFSALGYAGTIDWLEVDSTAGSIMVEQPIEVTTSITLYAANGITVNSSLRTTAAGYWNSNSINLDADTNRDGIGSFNQGPDSVIQIEDGYYWNHFIYINAGNAVTVSGLINAGPRFVVNTTGALVLEPDASITSGSHDIYVGGTWINNGASLNMGPGTVTFNGAETDNTITSAGASFDNLTVNGTGKWSLQDALSVNSSLSINSGTLDLNGKDLTLAEGASFSNDGTLKLLGSEALNNFTPDTDSGTTYYYGAGPYNTLPTGNNYYYLLLSSSDYIDLQTDVNAYIVEIYANNGVTIESSLMTTGSIYIDADWNRDGTGDFIQAEGSIMESPGRGLWYPWCRQPPIMIYAENITINGSLIASNNCEDWYSDGHIYISADANGDGIGNFIQGASSIIKTTGSGSSNSIYIYAPSGVILNTLSTSGTGNDNIQIYTNGDIALNNNLTFDSGIYLYADNDANGVGSINLNGHSLIVNNSLNDACFQSAGDMVLSEFRLNILPTGTFSMRSTAGNIIVDKPLSIDSPLSLYAANDIDIQADINFDSNIYLYADANRDGIGDLKLNNHSLNVIDSLNNAYFQSASDLYYSEIHNALSMDPSHELSITSTAGAVFIDQPVNLSGSLSIYAVESIDLTVDIVAGSIDISSDKDVNIYGLLKAEDLSRSRWARLDIEADADRDGIGTIYQALGSVMQAGQDLWMWAQDYNINGTLRTTEENSYLGFDGNRDNTGTFLISSTSLVESPEIYIFFDGDVTVNGTLKASGYDRPEIWLETSSGSFTQGPDSLIELTVINNPDYYWSDYGYFTIDAAGDINLKGTVNLNGEIDGFELLADNEWHWPVYGNGVGNLNLSNATFNINANLYNIELSTAGDINVADLLSYLGYTGAIDILDVRSTAGDIIVDEPIEIAGALYLYAADDINFSSDVTSYLINANANNGITVDGALTATSRADWGYSWGHIYLNADWNGDGIGSFTQGANSVIQTTGSGGNNYIYIYAGEDANLQTLTTSGTGSDYIQVYALGNINLNSDLTFDHSIDLRADYNGDGTGRINVSEGAQLTVNPAVAFYNAYFQSAGDLTLSELGLNILPASTLGMRSTAGSVIVDEPVNISSSLSLYAADNINIQADLGFDWAINLYADYDENGLGTLNLNGHSLTASNYLYSASFQSAGDLSVSRLYATLNMLPANALWIYSTSGNLAVDTAVNLNGPLYLYAAGDIALYTNPIFDGIIYLMADYDANGSGTLNLNSHSLNVTNSLSEAYFQSAEELSVNSILTVLGAEPSSILSVSSTKNQVIVEKPISLNYALYLFSGSDLEVSQDITAYGIKICSDNNITVTSALRTNGFDGSWIYLKADYNADGAGAFTQSASSVIETNGNNTSIQIYGKDININGVLRTNGTYEDSIQLYASDDLNLNSDLYFNSGIFLYADYDADGQGRLNLNGHCLNAARYLSNAYFQSAEDLLVSRFLADLNMLPSNLWVRSTSGKVTVDEPLSLGGLYLYAAKNVDIQQDVVASTIGVYADNGIMVNASLTANGGGGNYISLDADANRDGIGAFTQAAHSIIETTGSWMYITVYAEDILVNGVMRNLGNWGTPITLYADANRDGTGSFIQGAGSLIETSHPSYSWLRNNIITLYAGGDVTIGGSISAAGNEFILSTTNGSLILNSGANVSAHQHDISVGASWLNNGASLNLGSGTVTFNGAGTDNTITSAGVSFDNLTFSGTGKWSLQDALSINSSLSINSGTLDLNGKDLTLAEGASFSNDGTLKLLGSEALNNFTPDTDSGTVEYTGSRNYTGLIFGNTYYNLVIAGQRTYILTQALTVTNSLSINNGALDLAGYDLTLGGAFSNNGTLKLAGSENLTGFSNDTDSGTVEYTGTSAYSLIAGDTYYNLTISGSGAFTAAESLDVNHNFSQTNGTFIAPSGNFYVGNDFSHSGGIFNHNRGTVILDAEGSARLSGSTLFYNLTRISSGTQMIFEAGSTQTIISTLTLKGIPGEHLVLRSSSRGTQWKIDPQGARDIAYVNVQDSNNISAGVINPLDSLDNGNNANWFPLPIVITSTQIEQATNATNTATTSVTQIVVATITTLLQPEITSSLPELVSLGSGVSLVLVTEVSAPAASREAAQPTQETKPVVEETKPAAQEAQPAEEAKPTEKQAESKEEAKSEKKETAQEEAKAEKYGFDYSLHEEEGTEVKSKYKKHYIAGKYRTVVIVFEGKVVVNPYDEKGLKEKGVATLTEGQAASSEGKI